MSVGRMAIAAGLAAALFFPAPARPGTADVDLAAFFSEAAVTYEGGFFLPATLALWNGLLDRPVLVGRLWEAYRFSPSYRVSGNADFVRAADDAGIEGELFLLERSAGGRSYVGRGFFNHWAIPSFIAARVAVAARFREGRGGISGEVKIGLKGENGLTEILLRLFSGVMRRRIDVRFRSNMADLGKMLHDIAAVPERPRSLLAAEALTEYDAVLRLQQVARPAEAR